MIRHKSNISIESYHNNINQELGFNTTKWLSFKPPSHYTEIFIE